MGKQDLSLCWIRRDLRLHDHRALFEACAFGSRVAVVFVFDKVILDALPDKKDRRVAFIIESLKEVDSALRDKGSRLLVLYGDPLEVIPQLASKLKAGRVLANHDHDPYAIERDRKVAALLAEEGRSLSTFKDCVVFEKDEILNQSGTEFKVYTPYSRAWKARLSDADFQSYDPDLSQLASSDSFPKDFCPFLDSSEVGFEETDLWLKPGFSGGQERLAWFLERMPRYNEARDIPSVEGTSGISVHLRHGTLSIRECVRAAFSQSGLGSEKWLNELIWREFYHMILAQFPYIVSEPFQRHYSQLNWPGIDEHFDLWKAGQTGFPIVDAAMRCLAAMGWMHNRLRMITASFLTKDLLVDWRKGEAWFAETLLDFELASNNGGWQWSASMGVDAQPYFRVFNPKLQSQKFDPEGRFIRQWCPELSGFSDADIHAPNEAPLMVQIAAGCVIGEDYPQPIVDHQVQKGLAINLLRVEK